MARWGQDRLIGIAIVVIGAFLFWQTFSFRTVNWDPLGLSFWPRVVLGLLGVVGAYLIVRGSLDRGPYHRLEWRAFVVLGGAIVYVLAIDIVGFLVATPLYLFAFHLALGGVTRGHLVEAAIVAACATGLIYYIFEEALWVQFPEGMLAPAL